MKKKCTFMILTACSFFVLTSCTKKTEPATPKTEKHTESSEELQDHKKQDFVLTQTGKEFLEKMCLFLPEFSDASDLNEEFWYYFIFGTYTAVNEDSIGTAKEYDNIEFINGEVKVPRENIKNYAELALGIEFPEYEPSKQDMTEGQTPFYYQDGYYFIGVSDNPYLQYTYQECTVLEDDIKVQYKITLADEDIGTITFELVEAENENGFVIQGKSQLME